AGSGSPRCASSSSLGPRTGSDRQWRWRPIIGTAAILQARSTNHGVTDARRDLRRNLAGGGEVESKPARLLKEARSLFWPWCAVTSAGAVDFFKFFSTAGVICHGVSLLGFWVGIPMLAALSLGNEFQHRTLPLLLSQPVSRKTIWSEKWIVLLAAVGSATLVYWLAWRSMTEQDLTFRLVGVIALVSLCSSVFWTLVGKSTVGGVILNTLQAVIIFYLVQATLWLLALQSTPVTSGLVYAG